MASSEDRHAFQVEKNIGLVVLEHLGDKLNVHVLYVDILRDDCQRRPGPPPQMLAGLIGTCNVLFMTTMASLSFSFRKWLVPT